MSEVIFLFLQGRLMHVNLGCEFVDLIFTLELHYSLLAVLELKLDHLILE